jgi:hypothetical protein
VNWRLRRPMGKAEPFSGVSTFFCLIFVAYRSIHAGCARRSKDAIFNTFPVHLLLMQLSFSRA